MQVEGRIESFINGLYSDFLELQAEVEAKEGPSKAILRHGRTTGTDMDFRAYMRDILPAILAELADNC